MINLLPEEMRKEEQKKKAETPRIEMVRPGKPEPKFEFQPIPKPEVKPQPEPEEMEIDIEPTVKFPAEPEIKIEAKPEVKPEIKPEIKLEVGPEIKTEIKPEVRSEAETAAKPDLKPLIKEPKLEPKIKPTELKEGAKIKEKKEKAPGFFLAIKKVIQKIGQNIRKFFQGKPSAAKTGKEESALSKTFGSAGLEVTLMPEEIPITKRMVYEKLMILLAVIAFSVSIVFATWVWASWRCEQAQAKIAQVKIEMTSVEGQISRYQDVVNDIRKLEQKAERVNDLLNNHIYWTKFFKLLETYTIPDIYYGDFNGDIGGKIVLPSIGRDLIASARQLIALSNAPEFIKEVTITDLAGGVKGVSFNTNLTLAPEAFKK